jgi:FtsH-binding integral membrane protein
LSAHSKNEQQQQQQQQQPVSSVASAVIWLLTAQLLVARGTATVVATARIEAAADHIRGSEQKQLLLAAPYMVCCTM